MTDLCLELRAYEYSAIAKLASFTEQDVQKTDGDHLYGCKATDLTLREGNKLQVFENKRDDQ